MYAVINGREEPPMFGYIVAVAVVFGVIMGAREAVLCVQGKGTTGDARWTGVVAGVIFGMLALIVMLMLWAGFYFVYLYTNWALFS